MSKERIRAIEIKKCVFMSTLTRCFLSLRCICSRVGFVTVNPFVIVNGLIAGGDFITNRISTKPIFLYFGQEIYNRFRVAQIFASSASGACSFNCSTVCWPEATARTRAPKCRAHFMSRGVSPTMMNFSGARA